MSAPSLDLCNLWLARAFNVHDVDAALQADAVELEHAKEP